MNSSLIPLRFALMLWLQLKQELKKKKFPVTDINLTNYSYEYCPTESSAGGTLLYIGNHLLYTPRNDLRIYETAN